MLHEFKAFIAKGNVMDLAVAVIIGAAFGKIVTSLTEDIIMPVVGKVFGGLDFSNYFVRLGPVPPTFKGNPASYADLKAAGVSLLGYGEFITVSVNFVILAFIIFLLVRYAKKAEAEFGHKESEAPAAPTEVELLAEIRDELKRRP
ncbi:MAG: large conductance mechanosensitive channel protein MscL [Tsuneonella sp.]